ncbi:hypothetical protein ACFL96_17065 [Thermoproteota archaeon]
MIKIKMAGKSGISRISRKSRKAQVGMADLFIAASVFIILLVAIAFVYNLYSEKFQARQRFNRMQISAFQISNILVKSEGIPFDWETDPQNTVMIGLAGNKRIFSDDKVDAFLNMDYNMTKEIFKSGYDYNFKIYRLNGQILAEKGTNITGNATAVSMERRVLYDDEEVVMALLLWA